jgi:UDP-glucose 4-epimerase
MGRKRFIEKVLEKERDPEVEQRSMAAEALASISKVPPVAKVHPWFRTDLTDMRWLPINQEIDLPESAPAPLELLDRFIEESSHKVIYEACGCRTACKCMTYPREIGCLLMGDSAVESPGTVSREVGVDEAKAHVRRAVAAGLVPMVGKARVDNYIFGIKDRQRLLTVCFCCECCCVSRYEKYIKHSLLDEMFPRIDGVRIEVTPGCDGCGDCVERCYIGAISIEDGMAVLSDACRACGRCATICPRKAVKIHIEDGDFLEESYERIRAHVKHD